MTFLKDYSDSAIVNELLHPDQFRDLKPDITSNLYLHKLRPKIIGLSKCRLKKNKEPLPNIQLSNYKHELTSTESSKGGTMIYIENSLRYKIIHDLTMYKSHRINQMK